MNKIFDVGSATVRVEGYAYHQQDVYAGYHRISVYQNEFLEAQAFVADKWLGEVNAYQLYAGMLQDLYDWVGGMFGGVEATDEEISDALAGVRDDE